MEDVGFWLAAVVAAALVGMGKGGVPIVGMLAVPVMALVINPVVAAGLLLPVYVVSDMFGLYAYRHAFDRRVLAILLPGAIAGIMFGWATATVVPESVVTLLVGVIGLAFALNLILRKPVSGEPKRAEVAPGTVLGRGDGVHQLCQPRRRAALSGLHPAFGYDEGGLCRDLDYRFRRDQRGQADPLLCLGPAERCRT